MKAFSSCLMLVTFFASQTAAINFDNVEVPEKISKSFKMKYPNHTEPNWDDLGDVFVVSFYDNDDVLKEATFDLDGNWRETITSFDEEDMPRVMSTFIKKKYGDDAEFYEIVLSEKPEGNFYFINLEVAVGGEEEDDNEVYVLVFDEKGKFLREE